MVSLSFDCSWKKLQSIIARNLPGSPTSTYLEVASLSADFHLRVAYPTSCNPHWGNLEVPPEVFPLSIRILDSYEGELFAESLDSKQLYFVSDELSDISLSQVPFVLLEFADGYYTSVDSASVIYKRSRKSQSLVKLEITQNASYRQLDFAELAKGYEELLRLRQQLDAVEKTHASCKEAIESILASSFKAFPRIKAVNELQELQTDAIEHTRRQDDLLQSSDIVQKEFGGIGKVSDRFLEAHKKKYRERVRKASQDFEVMLKKEKLLYARKRKLYTEISIVFHGFRIRENFELAHTKNYDDVNAISTALGYCALVIDILADILKIRLRFPIKFQGSRSAIYVVDRYYPLYLVGKNGEIEKFERGLQWLTQNIYQLPRYYATFLLPGP